MEHLTKAERDDAVARIQHHFRAGRGEELGELAAVLILDFIETELAPAFYNRGVRDAKVLASRFAGSLLEELEYLQVLVPAARAAQPGKTARAGKPNA